jgi:hypothetical protein
MIAEYLFQRQQSEAFQPGDRVRSRRPFTPGGDCLNGVVQEAFTPKAPRRSRCPTIPRYLVVWEDRSFGWYVRPTRPAHVPVLAQAKKKLTPHAVVCNVYPTSIGYRA